MSGGFAAMHPARRVCINRLCEEFDLWSDFHSVETHRPVLLKSTLQPGAGATRTERFGPSGPRVRGGASAPGVDTPAALRGSDDPGVALGAEPSDCFVVEHQLSVFHGA